MRRFFSGRFYKAAVVAFRVLKEVLREVKLMKKGIVSFLLVILMMAFGSVTAYASPYTAVEPESEEEYDEAYYLALYKIVMSEYGEAELLEEEFFANKEQIVNGFKIDALFEKLRALDAEQLIEEIMLRETETDEEVIAAEKIRIREEYQKKSEKYEEELAKLGVVKVEPSNPGHSEMLLEMNGVSTSTKGGVPDPNLITLGVLGIAALLSLVLKH